MLKSRDVSRPIFDHLGLVVGFEVCGSSVSASKLMVSVLFFSLEASILINIPGYKRGAIGVVAKFPFFR